jgi:putative membrane protein
MGAVPDHRSLLVIGDWHLDAPALALAVGSAALYLRGAQLRPLPRPRRTASFLAGLGVVLFSQLGPVAVWSEVLFWPHMVQHLLLTLLAAPLLAAGRPLTTIRAGLPARPRRALVHAARTTRRWRRELGLPHPIVVATLAHVVTLWLWHWPPAYDAAVRVPAIHLVEHVTFLATAVWFWSEVQASVRRAPRTQALVTLCCGLLIAQGAVLGALLAFAGGSLYAVYDGAAGMTALEDQQLAGVLMWVPPGFVYGSLGVRRFASWLRDAEHDRALRERAGVAATAAGIPRGRASGAQVPVGPAGAEAADTDR